MGYKYNYELVLATPDLQVHDRTHAVSSDATETPSCDDQHYAWYSRAGMFGVSLQRTQLSKRKPWELPGSKLYKSFKT